MPKAVQSNVAATRWSGRIIPVVLLGFVGAAIYIVPAHLCVNYLYRNQGETGTAIALLVLFFLFLILSLWTYIRLFLTVTYDPALVPLAPGNEAVEKQGRQQHDRGCNTRPGRDIEAQPYIPPDQNPDSPGLEAFYSKRVFVCEADGRPKWCSGCRQWKPDRSHHSSELGRCIRKMDHLCPWVGGMVSETSFNFFIQFTFYATLLCTISLSTGAYSLSKQNAAGLPLDGRIVLVIVLASFFGFFTFGMTGMSLQYTLANSTNIDMLKKVETIYLAIRIPRDSPATAQYHTISYPLTSNPWWPTDAPANGQVGSSSTARDQQAISTFAIVRTNPNENPWDLGYWGNFKSVMGNNVFEWFLPIAHSPCCNHDSMESDYELGDVVHQLKKQHGLPDDSSETDHEMEMRSSRRERREQDRT